MPKRELVVEVLNDSCDKTRKVILKTINSHPKFGKTLRTNKTFLIHDQQNASTRGDLIRIVEAPPSSRRKRWLLAEVLQKRSVI